MKKRIIDTLIEMGIPANLKGFQYIVDAMEIYSRDESYISAKRMALYRKIAKQHNTTAVRVERCIRNAFEKATVYGSLNALNKHMSAAQQPTNSKDTVLRLSAVCKKGTSYNNKTVKIQIEPGSVATEYEPYKEPQTAIITTPEPLRASKGGAYKDRVYLDGTVERQIEEVVFDGSEDEGFVKNDDSENSYIYYTGLYKGISLIGGTCLCNHLIEKSVSVSNGLDDLFINTTNEYNVIYVNLGYYMTENTVAELRRVLSENPITVQYVLAEPVTEELNASSKAALQALRTNYHNTVVTNDQDAEMELEYVCDTKTYVDNKIAAISAAIL